MTYAIVEIAGKQFKVEPNKQLFVPFLAETGDFECDKVLLIVDGDNLEVGAPFLKKTLKFSVLSSKRSKKIRVAKYHAKANTRKVRGSREIRSLIKLS